MLHKTVRRLLGLCLAGLLVVTFTPSAAAHTQGCSPGYWKNHFQSWLATGYSPGQPVMSVFTVPASLSALGTATLLQALDFGGGTNVEGAARILLRAATAGILNAAHPGVSYPAPASAIVAQVNGALALGDRGTMLSLASLLDTGNNLGCPID